MIVNRVEYDGFFTGRPLTFSCTTQHMLLLIKTDFVLTQNGFEKLYPARQALYCLPGHSLELAAAQRHLVLDYVEFTLSGEEQKLYASLPIRKLEPFPAPNFADLCNIVKDLYDMYDSGDKYRSEKSDAFLRLLLYCTASGDEEPDNSSRLGQLHYRLRQLRRKISDDPSRFGTVAEAAAFVQISPSWFQTAYRQYFHVSYVNDLIHIRIKKGCALLRSTDWTVAQIAETLGYTYETYFYRAFKQRMGMSPREYRQSTGDG